MKKVIILILIAASVWGIPYKIGQSVVPLDLQDQYGKRATFKVMPKTLILAYEKETAATVNEFLNGQVSGYLKKYNAAFVADISGMPNFITEAFALPKMRKYSHTVLLIRDEEEGLKFPGKEEKITVMKFNGNVVASITYISTAAELQAAIEQ